MLSHKGVNLNGIISSSLKWNPDRRKTVAQLLTSSFFNDCAASTSILFNTKYYGFDPCKELEYIASYHEVPLSHGQLDPNQRILPEIQPGFIPSPPILVQPFSKPLVQHFTHEDDVEMFTQHQQSMLQKYQGPRHLDVEGINGSDRMSLPIPRVAAESYVENNEPHSSVRKYTDAAAGSLRQCIHYSKEHMIDEDQDDDEFKHIPDHLYQNTDGSQNTNKRVYDCASGPQTKDRSCGSFASSPLLSNWSPIFGSQRHPHQQQSSPLADNDFRLSSDISCLPQLSPSAELDSEVVLLEATRSAAAKRIPSQNWQGLYEIPDIQSIGEEVSDSEMVEYEENKSNRIGHRKVSLRDDIRSHGVDVHGVHHFPNFSDKDGEERIEEFDDDDETDTDIEVLEVSRVIQESEDVQSSESEVEGDEGEEEYDDDNNDNEQEMENSGSELDDYNLYKSEMELPDTFSSKTNTWESSAKQDISSSHLSASRVSNGEQYGNYVYNQKLAGRFNSLDNGEINRKTGDDYDSNNSSSPESLNSELPAYDVQEPAVHDDGYISAINTPNFSSAKNCVECGKSKDYSKSFHGFLHEEKIHFFANSKRSKDKTKKTSSHELHDYHDHDDNESGPRRLISYDEELFTALDDAADLQEQTTPRTQFEGHSVLMFKPNNNPKNRGSPVRDVSKGKLIKTAGSPSSVKKNGSSSRTRSNQKMSSFGVLK